ncbi:tetratricopeptide repeat protein [Hymenobacter sp. BT18]|uniref:type IX secretion system periplasmic lipoprotein PorW/SprE n=1 Tax=Hymenobacter sp. BT18 TaxID=2835648 RepID=UPI00143E70F4|nr:tetratricopeptide repeat protein [Hymenobacter sp. BT18]QIX61957.1 tetratricopeptide repeat protein [Hymenobacter sp. BT18]
MTRTLLSRLLFWPSAALVVAASLHGCASERGPVGRTYQNIVARDNAYFLAREKMRTVEEDLNKARLNDYNRVLPLFPTIDSLTAVRLAPDMEDIIKKTSIPIQYHPGSDWTDDSYILVGKARYYKRELEDAIKTFKYVNTTSKDPHARHEALIWLMRSFLALKEYESASAVSDILDKEVGTESNAKALFLTRAEYYLRTDNQPLAIANLEKALPYITPKNEQSRTRYVLAQLYQAQGNDKKAYAQLNQILKRNPPYELDFYSKLMLGQVSDLNQNDRARLDKYFAKLLKDTKNKEYGDKIYYEMARLEYRQQRYPEALKLLQKSARATGSTQAQKSYTYLLAGRINYENLQKYRPAAAYYDSTVQNLSRESPDYAAIAERSAILQEFAKQLTIVDTQDSLQALAKLDTATLRTRLLSYAEAELAAKAAEEKRLADQRERESRRQTATGVSSVRSGNPDIDPFAFANANTGAQWYFDNPTSLSTARSEFVRRWGDRPLQDNWRITSTASTSPATARGGNVPITVAGSDATQVNAPGTAAAALNPAQQAATLAAQYRQNIPLTAELLAASSQQIEEALFALGSIYGQQLREPAKAAETYETLLTRFPTSKHAPEVYYSLFLLYKEAGSTKADEYAQRLRQEFPTSSYARLVADPEYLRRMSVANAGVSVQLDSAFAFYKQQEFKKAGRVLTRTRKLYPESDYNDRVAYLGVLLALRTQPPATTKAQVARFVKEYPNSPLVTDAQSLLETFARYEQGSLPGALASTDKPRVSYFRPGEVDNRMRIFYGANESPVVVPKPAVPAPVEAATPAAPTPAAPASATPAPSPDKTPATTPPAVAEPVAAAVPAPATATPGGPDPAPTAPVSPYAANLSANHAVVLVIAKDAPLLATLPTQLTAYNNRYYRAANLQVQQQPLGDGFVAVVVQSLAGSKVAQSYALKLRGPQGPLGRLRGVGYQSLIVGIENLPVLLQRQNVAEYEQFYQQAYRP